MISYRARLIPSLAGLLLVAVGVAGCSHIPYLKDGKSKNAGKTADSADSADRADSADGADSADSADRADSADGADSGDSTDSVAKFTDNDEGSTGALQDAHEGQVVFAQEVIPRKDATEKPLVTNLTLGKPLFVRAFFPKTPARLMHEANITCDEEYQNGWWVARRVGSDNTYTLKEANLGDLAGEIRTVAFTPPDGGDISSIMSVKEYTVTRERSDYLSKMGTLLAELESGDNQVEVAYMVGCASRGKYGRKWVAAGKGTLKITLGKGDLKKFYAAAGPRVPVMDPGNTKKYASMYKKLLVKGAKLLDFSAGQTHIESLDKKWTNVHVILLNADGLCTYHDGQWVEPYLGGGKYDKGTFEYSHRDKVRVPCPK